MNTAKILSVFNVFCSHKSQIIQIFSSLLFLSPLLTLGLPKFSRSEKVRVLQLSPL